MSNVLSEPGRLYLADVDALEEARRDLEQYVDAVWDACRSELGGGEPSVGGLPWRMYAWKETRHASGAYYSPGVKIEVCVADPFESDPPPTFEVWLRCSETERKRLARTGGQEEAIAIARSHDVTLGFEDASVLASDRVEFDHADAAALGRRLAVLLRRYLELAVAIHRAVGPSSSVDAADEQARQG